MRVRVHTAPPLPLFIHCAQDSPQPPLDTPDQLSDSDAAALHVPSDGLPNCWKSGADSDDDPPPPPSPPNSPLVMTRFPVPELLTATKSPLPYVTDRQSLFAAEARLVQVMPSGLVMTRFPVPSLLTATKSPLP